MADVLPSFDFLADNYQNSEDAELYAHLAPLLDWALTPSVDDELFPVEELAGRLGIGYESSEAVNAYINKFVKPILGTRNAMDFAFKLAGTNANIIEWSQSDTPVPKFKFIIEFDKYPGTLDLPSLLSLIYALKNERSWPTEIRMGNCAENMILDYGRLSEAYLDAPEGVLDASGVTLCLYDEHKGIVDLSGAGKMRQGAIGHRADWIQFDLAFVLDHTLLGSPWEEAWAAVIGSKGAITGLYGAFDETPNIKPITRSGAFDCQMILSEHGTLSGGEGFFGVELTLDPEMELDNFLLDDVRLVERPICEFVWTSRAAEVVDMVPLFPAPKVRTFRTELRTQRCDVWSANFDAEPFVRQRHRTVDEADDR